ncbi:MAG TPA: tetratricopeptide repeat protein, partial [Blastocatellia bacterium]
AHAGKSGAAQMASVTISQIADCLMNLGRLDEAATEYQEAITRSEELGDRRQAAVGKLNLGTVRLQQKRYKEAMEAYTEVRATFEALGEPRTAAGAWHQIGIVYQEARQFGQAESAYRRSLAIMVREKDLAGEAATLNQLGNLYEAMVRLEESVKCCRRAADIYIRLQDLSDEGLVRNNLAIALIKLRRYDEARRELLRAIECKKPYGHAAEPWKTWGVLYDLEQATGYPEAAAQAREQALESYLAYRRAGGQSYDWGAKACAAVAEAIMANEPSAIAALADRLSGALQELSQTQAGSRVNAVMPKLQAILAGSREHALADDPALWYVDAVELKLLLESLTQ